MTRDVRRLVDRVRHQGGTARVLSIAFTGPAEEKAVAEPNAARDAVEEAALRAEAPGPR